MYRANNLDLVQPFMENCEAGASLEELSALFRHTVERLGFRYFACISHSIDPFHSSPNAVMVHNYPPRWVKLYAAERLRYIDPVLRRAEENPMPFFWDTAFAKHSTTPMQRQVLVKASNYGLVHGYTIPIHLSWLPGSLRASCSIVPSGTIEMSNYRAIELMATYLFAAVCQRSQGWCATIPKLTHRERQCMELVASGKDDRTMSRMLQLSERTVHEYVERAKQRFGVATRIQAVVRALATGQISFGKVLPTGEQS